MNLGTQRNHSIATNGVDDLYNFLPQLIPPGSGPGNSHSKYENRKGYGGQKGGHGWDGGSGGYYGYGNGGGGGSGSSPAISALALLGFLFFLNLIQNSLTFNRIFMSTSTITTSNTTTVTGGSSTVIVGRTGRERQKRGLSVERNHQAYSDPISSQPIRHLFRQSPQELQGKKDLKKSELLNCFQLLACQLGKNAYANLGKSSQRTFLHYWKLFINSDNGSEWSNDVLWALKRGGRSKKTCRKMFTKC